MSKVGTISKASTDKILAKEGQDSLFFISLKNVDSSFLLSLLHDRVVIGEGLTGKESKNASKEGWLTKQGNYIKNWRPRWFQLKDGILYYYKDPQAVSALCHFSINLSFSLSHTLFL